MTDHLSAPGWTDVRILSEYRHQGIVEGVTGFRRLKGPAAVSPMFPKTPTRIRALGLVMILALTVRNYWQFAMRRAARTAGEKVKHPFTKQPASNLRAEMAMERFGGVQALRIRLDGVRHRGRTTVSATPRQILGYLAVSEAVFCTPPIDKCRILVV